MGTFFRSKKVPIIPPLFINKKLVTKFKAKAKYFNDFFACKCSSIVNNNGIAILRPYYFKLSLTIMIFKNNKSSIYQQSS